MQTTKQIQALLQLLDDPDAEVYDTVAEKIVQYGDAIIPNLETLWESTVDEAVQNRIEWLIHRVHFEKLQQELFEWCHKKNPSLLQGALLVAQYAYPELNHQDVHFQIDKMRKNIWLELNNYLTPLEQVNIFNSILYNYYKLHGHELTDRKPEHFFINKVLESKQGNVYTLGILFLSLCDMLDVPIFAVDIPRQFIVAYIDSLHHFYHLTDDKPITHIQFFIDPLNGLVYTKNDVDSYLKKLAVRPEQKMFLPINATRIIYKLLEELHLCYSYNREEDKAAEIHSLMNILAAV